MKEIENKFEELATVLENETGGLSITRQKTAHLNYGKIVAMGKDAIPLILNRLLKNRSVVWFAALREITGENISIDVSLPGKPGLMEDLWREWGKEKGYIS